jgi:pectin methylesterase-like acyl-CoA thioesterase
MDFQISLALTMVEGIALTLDCTMLNNITVKNVLAALTSLSTATYTKNVLAMIKGDAIQVINVEIVVRRVTFFVRMSSAYLLLRILV